MGAISKLGTSYTFRRFSPGYYEKGNWVPGVEIVPHDANGNSVYFSMIASIQRLSAQETVALPDGQRTREWIRIYTETRLERTIEEEKTKGDVVQYGGAEYEVVKVEDWTMSPISHYKILAVRIGN